MKSRIGTYFWCLNSRCQMHGLLRPVLGADLRCRLTRWQNQCRVGQVLRLPLADLLHKQPNELVPNFLGIGLGLGKRRPPLRTSWLTINSLARLLRRLNQPLSNLRRQLRLPIRSLRHPWSSLKIPLPKLNSVDFQPTPSNPSDSTSKVRRAPLGRLSAATPLSRIAR